jgi:hypothetical protein
VPSVKINRRQGYKYRAANHFSSYHTAGEVVPNHPISQQDGNSGVTFGHGVTCTTRGRVIKGASLSVVSMMGARSGSVRIGVLPLGRLINWCFQHPNQGKNVISMSPNASMSLPTHQLVLSAPQSRKNKRFISMSPNTCRLFTN